MFRLAGWLWKHKASVFLLVGDLVDQFGLWPVIWVATLTGGAIIMAYLSQPGAFIGYVGVIATIALAAWIVAAFQYVAEKRKVVDIPAIEPEDERRQALFDGMIRTDAVSPDKCLLVRPLRVQVSTLRNPNGPFMIIQFSIYNGSVFDIEIGVQVTGHIELDDSLIKDQPELPQGASMAIVPRTSASSIEIQQFVLPDVANTLLDFKGEQTKQFKLEFQHVKYKIPAHLTYRGGSEPLVTWDCPFPKKVTYRMSANDTIAFPA